MQQGTKLVVLGMGGTIAGVGTAGGGALGYRAGQLGVEVLLEGLAVTAPGFESTLHSESVNSIDSKDMDDATWLALAQRCRHHLQQDEVAGLVITHGTDTLEETAWFLQCVLPPGKPVVLTCAMRPATALSADGPANLRDALAYATDAGARQRAAVGQHVCVVVGGAVHGAQQVQKVHPYRLSAFSSGEEGPWAWVEEQRVRHAQALPPLLSPADPPQPVVALPPVPWPWVAVVHSHAGVRAQAVDALVAAGVQGLVLAGTGNGTLHGQLEAALQRAQAAGVRLWLCSRCALGQVVTDPRQGQDIAVPGLEVTSLSPWKARISLMLALLQGRAGESSSGHKKAPGMAQGAGA